MTNELINKILGLATNDYQQTCDAYTISNIPVSIDTTLHNDTILIDCVFKHTTENSAKQWLYNKLKDIGVDVDSIIIETCQEGTYNDEIVCAYSNIDFI